MVPLAKFLPFVVTFLADRQADLDFGQPTAIEVETNGNQRGAGLGDFGDQFLDFPAVQQKTAVAKGLVIAVRRGGVTVDLKPVKRCLVTIYAHKGIRELGLSGSQTFDLTARQDNAGFESLENMIIVPGFFIDDPALILFGLFCHNY